MLKPATRFLTNTLDEQFLHIRCEVEEAKDAKIDYQIKPSQVTKASFIEELVDIQMGVETMLAIMGLTLVEREIARAKVIEKNRVRGYYKKVVSGNAS